MLDEALREFRRVLDLRDADAAARFYVGLVLARQEKWADAELALGDCLALLQKREPDDWKTFNIQSLLGLMVSDEGELSLDFDDEVIAGACITRDGQIVHEGARNAAEVAA